MVTIPTFHQFSAQNDATSSDEKLQKALRHKTRTVISLIYQNSDQVYYKNNDSWYWKGPVKVRGINNKQVFVRYGGYVRANPNVRATQCNFQLVNDPVKDHKE